MSAEDWADKYAELSKVAGSLRRQVEEQAGNIRTHVAAWTAATEKWKQAEKERDEAQAHRHTPCLDMNKALLAAAERERGLKETLRAWRNWYAGDRDAAMPPLTQTKLALLGVEGHATPTPPESEARPPGGV